jgi:hypothetical protein
VAKGDKAVPSDNEKSNGENRYAVFPLVCSALRAEQTAPPPTGAGRTMQSCQLINNENRWGVKSGRVNTDCLTSVAECLPSRVYTSLLGVLKNDSA